MKKAQATTVQTPLNQNYLYNFIEIPASTSE